MTTKTKTEPLTTSMIRSLRDEAANAQDLPVEHACNVALGTEEPITTAEAWEERYGGGGHSSEEREDVLAVTSQERARALVAEAINGARGQDDEGEFVRVVP